MIWEQSGWIVQGDRGVDELKDGMNRFAAGLSFAVQLHGRTEASCHNGPVLTSRSSQN